MTKKRFGVEYRKAGWVVVDRAAVLTTNAPVIAGPFSTVEAAQAKADRMNVATERFMSQLFALVDMGVQ